VRIERTGPSASPGHPSHLAHRLRTRRISRPPAPSLALCHKAFPYIARIVSPDREPPTTYAFSRVVRQRILVVRENRSDRASGEGPTATGDAEGRDGVAGPSSPLRGC